MTKNVFAYCKFNKNLAGQSLHRYEFLSAVSEDGKHYFEFTINQNDYRGSVQKCWTKFEAFCKSKCGLTDSKDCYVWFAHDMGMNPNEPCYDFIGDFDNELCVDFDHELGCCGWCCYETLETNYYYQCTHIKKPLSFVQFKQQNGYSIEDEPFATKRLYNAYKAEIDKSEYSEEEIENIAEYIRKHAYDYYSGFSQCWKLIESFLKLAGFDKRTFVLCMDYLIECHKQKRQERQVKDIDKKFKSFIEDYFAETYYYEKLNNEYSEQDDGLPFWEHPKSKIFHSLNNAEWLKTFFE